MTATPRSTIRAWLRDTLASGATPQDALDTVTMRAVDDADLVAELVLQIVRAELSGLQRNRPTPRPRPQPTAQPGSTGQRTSAREEIDEAVADLPPDSPLAKLSPAPMFDQERSASILVDLSRMTRIEVLNLAEEFESAAQKNEELAAFCRAVAERMSADQTVGQVFPREALLKIRSRITTHSTTKVYLGQSLVAVSERTN